MCKLKKLEAPERDDEADTVSIEKLLIGSISRGLTLEGVKEMEIGQLVDYCIEYNTQNDDEARGGGTKAASQADWDKFFG